MIVCFFGDSLTNGVNDPEGLGWVGRLCNEARRKGRDITAYNLGVRRQSSRDILARWQDEASRRKLGAQPMRLVFAFGAVDACLDPEVNLELDESLANARAILSEAAKDHELLMIGPPAVAAPEFAQRAAALSTALGELCEELDVPFLSILPELQESEIYMADLASGDGVHPGSGGYANIFRLVEGWDAWRAWLKD
ncbi:MAG: hypothetical protein D6E12_11455 [Desulfovibrio sp.]|nr:MAG: hypothetical protein D6E12_11455 [Desulfovibrio sp.]